MSGSTFSSSRSPLGCLSVIIAVGLVTVPGDARGQDTTVVVQDTVAQDSVEAADTMPPPPVLPELAFPFAQRRAAGVWHWDQEALAATAAVTVLDLLDQIPGVATFRSGLLLQPEAASAFGGTSARVEIDLDGYVLDPMAASALDLSTIALSNVTDVLIERRLDLLRIRLRSASPNDARPYSRIEAGTGQPDANLFRGIFLAPDLWIGPFGVSVERLDTEGSRSIEPADVFDTWVKWGWQSERRGIQFEMRQSTLDREAPSPWPATRKRRDLVLRARNRFGEAVTAEAYVGQATVDIEPLGEDASLPDSLSSHIERSGVQAGIRTSVDLPNGWLEASLRARDEPSLPRLQTDVGAGFSLGGIAALRADVTHQSWRDADAMLSLSARADLGPFYGVVPFVEWTTGERGAPLFSDSTLAGPLIDNRTAFRVGAEAAFPWVTLGGALLHTEVDSVPAFRLPFDRAAHSYAGGSVDGFEAYGRLRLYFDWLAAEGSYQRWLSGQRWAYLPVEEGRGALTMDWTPLESGNLQIIGFLEARRRGNVLSPNPDDDGLTLVTLPSRTTYNAYLQIRIMSLRIFARYDNLSGQPTADILGREIGPRFFYGVKWSFWN